MDEIKALTVWQPWAQLLAYGAKRFETRTWTTGYRGPLVIHAAKRTPTYAEYQLMNTPSGRWAKETFDIPSSYALGAAVAVATLAEVHPAKDVVPDLCMEHAVQEFRFGNFSEGRYAWELADVQLLEHPVPCRGRQGLWTPDDGLRARIERHLPADATSSTETPKAA